MMQPPDTFRYRRPKSSRAACGLMLLALFLPFLATPAAAHPVAVWLVLKAVGVVAGGAKLRQMQADWAYAKAPRRGSCEARRESILQILPDALRYAHLSSDIYGHGTGIKSVAAMTLPLAGGGLAYYEPQGERYAEVHIDKTRNEALVVFRGTRLTVRGDLSADALGFIGIESGYYRWAAALVGRVAREHPDMRIKLTGHSLGGGLVLYAVLRNPGVEGIAFDPAGLSWATWIMASRVDRARANAALTIVSTRNAEHVEPLTSIALAHRTVLPGSVYFAETDASGSMALHRATTLVSALERLDATQARGHACDGVLGQLAR